METFKIGVRAHDVGKLGANELAVAVKSFGFDGVQLVFPKALGQNVDEVDIQEVRIAFKDSIILIGAYFNMIHPDLDVVSEGIKNFKKNLKAAHLLKVKYVASETGSLMGSPWNYVEGNHSDESFNKVVNVTRDLLEEAAKLKVHILIEGAWQHTIYSPKRLRQLVDELDHPNLDVIIDLYNFLNIDNHMTHIEIFKESLTLLKDRIQVIHLKDYIIEDNKLKQVGLGQGLMNYKEIFKLIKSFDIKPNLVFEGVTRDDLKSSIEFIKNIINKEGV